MTLKPCRNVAEVLSMMDWGCGHDGEAIRFVQVLQDDYNGAVNGTGDQTVAEVLASYEGTQARRLPLY